MVSQPTVISTFAGCGGSSLGYKWAGFHELLAIDFDKNAVETFKLNFPEVPVWQRDVCAVTAEEILDFCHIKKGDLDVLDGSPPCQGFSTAGKRIVTDSRNDLFKEFVRLIEGLSPKVFVMENVSGMVKGKMKGKFIEVMQTLKALDYNVKCKLMNVMYYGVPQSRQRLIWIGVRKDLKVEPSFPNGNGDIISFRMACNDLNIMNDDDRILSPVIIQVAERQPIKWNTDQKIYQGIKGNHAGMISLKWAIWDKVCGTLPKSEISLTGIIHPDRKRYISLNEAKRIGSFPDEFRFSNRTLGIMLIGNAGMPKFMQAIATHIKTEILRIA